MSDLRLRPRFRMHTPRDPAEVLARLGHATSRPDGPVSGTVFTSSVVLTVAPSAQHVWSPRLELSVDAAPGGGTELHGLFGPAPTIWSLFVALYAAAGFLGTMGMVYGWSEWTLGGSGAAMWAGPGAVLVSGLVYAAGRLGRHFGRDQMVLLRTVVDESLDA